MLRKHSATITTNGSGAATVYLGSVITGKILAFKYEPTSIATGGDLTFTGETSEQPILIKANAGTSTVWYYPKAPANLTTDGSASTLTEVPLCLYRERIKLVVAQGGATTTGTITVYTDEEP